MIGLVTFFGHNLSVGDLIIFYIVAMLVGMAKTGVQGAGLLSVPLLAIVFGGQSSTGILLPVLCVADMLGVAYYHRHADWTQLRRLFPWAALGTLIGTVVGNVINDAAFKTIMAIAILGSVAMMVFMRNEKMRAPGPAAARFVGVLGGFTSMVGNLAGPMMAVFFLFMQLPKLVFIGTSAWFFLALNFFKIPFHVFHWKTINLNTFYMTLTAVPVVVAGAGLGVLIVRNLSERFYRQFIIVMTILAAILMLVL